MAIELANMGEHRARVRANCQRDVQKLIKNRKKTIFIFIIINAGVLSVRKK